MATENGVVRTDKLRATKVGHLESLKYEDGKLENGMICFGGDYEEDNREVRNVVKPNSSDLDTEPAILIASPELNYDEYKRTDNALEKFYIPEGEIARGYHLEKGDIFSVSDNMIDAVGDDPEVDNYVTAQDDSFKIKEREDGYFDMDDYKFVGKIIAKDSMGTTTYIGSNGEKGRNYDLYKIQVIKN